MIEGLGGRQADATHERGEMTETRPDTTHAANCPLQQ